MTYQPGFDRTRVECKSGGLWSNNNFARCSACQARNKNLLIWNNFFPRAIKTRKIGKRYRESLEIYKPEVEKPQIKISPVLLAYQPTLVHF